MTNNQPTSQEELWNELQEILSGLLIVGYKLGQVDNILEGGEEVKQVKDYINRHYIAKEAVVPLITEAFKASTYLNKDDYAKYWSAEGDYNKQAMDKFFPQEWFDEKLLPALKEKIMSKQAMPLALVLVRQSIEDRLAGVKELLPDSYKITFVAVTNKPNQEIVLTESRLTDIGELLIEHGKEQL